MSSSSTPPSSSTTTSSITPTKTTPTTNRISSSTKQTTTWKDAFAGACAGAFAKTAVAPIERVKLVLQLQSSLTTPTTTNQQLQPPKQQQQQPYLSSYKNKSALEIASLIYQEQGLAAFWRGNVPNVLRQGGTSAINFMLMDVYKTTVHSVLLQQTMKWPSTRSLPLRHKRRSVWSSFISGGLAGGTTTTILYPIEFLRTRLALDVGTSSSPSSSSSTVSKSSTTTTTPVPRLYPRGMRDVFCQTWSSDGWKGLYQGYGIALVGVVLYRALHMGGYDALKTEWMYYQQTFASNSSNSTSNSTSLSWKERFVAAQTVSLMAGTLCYPIDSIRRRLMMQAGTVPIHKRPYRNSWQCTTFVWNTEGLRGFYLGLGPNLVRSLGGAILLVGYDMFKVML